MRSLFRRRPAPPPQIERAPAAIPPGERVYAIGDIHGRLDLMEELLDTIHHDDSLRGPAQTRIVLLGDLIDRGAESAGVVRRAMAGDARFAAFTVLKGNHEASLLAVLEGETRWLTSWLGYGGRAALESWGVTDAVFESRDPLDICTAAARAVPTDERRWLADLPTSERIGDYLFVHAGVRPGVPLDNQREEDLLWIREEFLEDDSDHGVMVVHGHTISPDPEVRCNRVGIDTGAYRSGTLTALGLEGTQRWFLATDGG